MAVTPAPMTKEDSREKRPAPPPPLLGFARAGLAAAAVFAASVDMDLRKAAECDRLTDRNMKESILVKLFRWTGSIDGDQTEHSEIQGIQFSC